MEDLIINELEISHYLKDVVFVEKILEQNLDPHGFNITVAEPIGVPLKELFYACDRQFSINTVLMIGLKIVRTALFSKLRILLVQHSDKHSFERHCSYKFETI